LLPPPPPVGATLHPPSHQPRGIQRTWKRHRPPRHERECGRGYYRGRHKDQTVQDIASTAGRDPRGSGTVFDPGRFDPGRFDPRRTLFGGVHRGLLASVWSAVSASDGADERRELIDCGRLTGLVIPA